MRAAVGSGIRINGLSFVQPDRRRFQSEGRGLSHEDERCYSGRISEAEDGATGARTISVRGNVVFGTDLGTDARPEPVGTFFILETRGTLEPSPDP